MRSRALIAVNHAARASFVMPARPFSPRIATEGRAERVVRWLFVGSFLLAVVAFVALAAVAHDIVAFEVTILLIDWIVLTASGALMSPVVWRTGHAAMAQCAAIGFA